MVMFWHLGRLVADILLMSMMLLQNIYELPISLVILMFFRIIAGHGGRIAQRVFNLLYDSSEILVALISAAIKVVLEIVILAVVIKSKNINVTDDFIVIAVLIMIGRSAFESLSVCKKFIDDFSD